jgi:hypothetical protein
VLHGLRCRVEILALSGRPVALTSVDGNTSQLGHIPVESAVA